MNNQNLYNNLKNTSFWRIGVVEKNPYNIDNIYKNKFSIKQL